MAIYWEWERRLRTSAVSECLNVDRTVFALTIDRWLGILLLAPFIGEAWYHWPCAEYPLGRWRPRTTPAMLKEMDSRRVEFMEQVERGEAERWDFSEPVNLSEQQQVGVAQ